MCLNCAVQSAVSSMHAQINLGSVFAPASGMQGMRTVPGLIFSCVTSFLVTISLILLSPVSIARKTLLLAIKV